MYISGRSDDAVALFLCGYLTDVFCSNIRFVFLTAFGTLGLEVQLLAQ